MFEIFQDRKKCTVSAINAYALIFYSTSQSREETLVFEILFKLT